MSDLMWIGIAVVLWLAVVGLAEGCRRLVRPGGRR